MELVTDFIMHTLSDIYVIVLTHFCLSYNYFFLLRRIEIIWLSVNLVFFIIGLKIRDYTLVLTGLTSGKPTEVVQR
jgi:hypothetical protein